MVKVFKNDDKDLAKSVGKCVEFGHCVLIEDC